jgi:glycosyltransferase involved in cell wall biosynthesis
MSPDGTQVQRPSLSICFPAFNEEQTIYDVIRQAHQSLAGSGLDYEILVCDDASADRTGQIADSLAAELSHIRVLHHRRNLGIRQTFEELYRESSKDFVFLNSTDGQWDTSIALDMLPMTDRWDIIVARRISKPYGPWRRFVSYAFNLLPLLFFGVQTYDAGSVKLVRRSIIESLQTVSKSPFVESERIIRARRAGYRVTQLPVHVAPRRAGTSRGAKPAILLTACLDIPRVWWSLRSSRRES